MASQTSRALADAITGFDQLSNVGGSDNALSKLQAALDQFKQDAVHQAVLTAQRQVSVATVSTTAPLTNTGGPNPTIGLTIPLPVVDGGTGATAQNFVDLTTAQSIAGTKKFANGALGTQLGPAVVAPQYAYGTAPKIWAGIINLTFSSSQSATLTFTMTGVTFSGAGTFVVCANLEQASTLSVQFSIATYPTSGTTATIAAFCSASLNTTVPINIIAYGY